MVRGVPGADRPLPERGIRSVAWNRQRQLLPVGNQLQAGADQRIVGRTRARRFKVESASDLYRWDWYDDSLGIEELGFICGLSIPANTRPLFGCYDQGIWRPRNFDYSRDTPIFPNGGSALQVDHCYALDYSPDDAAYVVGIVNYNNQEAGYSSDGGATWHVFAAQHPDSAGGGLRRLHRRHGCYRKDHLGAGQQRQGGQVERRRGQLVVHQHGRFVRRNLKLGQLDLHPPQHRFQRQATAGYAEIIVNNSNQGITAGVYQTTDHGATWTLKFSGVIDSGADTAQFWNATLSYVPGKSGELLYTAGKAFNSLLKASADDGVTWSTLRSGEVDHVNLFGFGKAYTGQSYPAVYFDGNVNGISGVYRSKDFFATTPELLARFPKNEVNSRSFIMGDMNTYGRLFVGINGKGLLYGNFA
jgi:hypothetical protein